MMHANPPGFPEGPNTTFLVGALLILAALLLVAFFPKRETKIAALVATLLGLAMAGFRRKDEKEEEEPTKRSEQNDATKEMDATIEMSIPAASIDLRRDAIFPSRKALMFPSVSRKETACPAIASGNAWVCMSIIIARIVTRYKIPLPVSNPAEIDHVCVSKAFKRRLCLS